MAVPRVQRIHEGGVPLGDAHRVLWHLVLGLDLMFEGIVIGLVMSGLTDAHKSGIGRILFLASLLLVVAAPLADTYLLRSGTNVLSVITTFGQ